MIKYATENPNFIAPRVLMKSQNLITVMVLKDIIQILGLASLKIAIVWPFVQLVGVFASIIPFDSPVELVLVLILFFFH